MISGLRFVDKAEVNAGEDGIRPAHLGQELGKHGVWRAVADKRSQCAGVGIGWSAIQGVHAGHGG